MGFSIKEIKYKNRYLLFLTDPKKAGPRFSFKLKGKRVGTIPVVLHNIEPTPIYKLVNSRKGTSIHRITLDFGIKEYLKILIKNKKLIRHTGLIILSPPIYRRPCSIKHYQAISCHLNKYRERYGIYGCSVSLYR